MERLDRFVIGQAFEIMSQDRELTLSINMTGQTSAVTASQALWKCSPSTWKSGRNGFFSRSPRTK